MVHTGPVENEQQEGSGGQPPSLRPPIAVAPLRAWWIVLAGLLVAMLFILTDHMLRATVSLAGTLLLAAAFRLVLSPEQAGGVVARGKVTDVGVLVTLGVLVLISGFSLDLTAR